MQMQGNLEMDGYNGDLIAIVPADHSLFLFFWPHILLFGRITYQARCMSVFKA